MTRQPNAWPVSAAAAPLQGPLSVVALSNVPLRAMLVTTSPFRRNPRRRRLCQVHNRQRRAKVNKVLDFDEQQQLSIDHIYRVEWKLFKVSVLVRSTKRRGFKIKCSSANRRTFDFRAWVRVRWKNDCVLRAHRLIQNKRKALWPCESLGLPTNWSRRKRTYTFLFAIFTCAQRTREHFCPQHWLLCHLGLY